MSDDPNPPIDDDEDLTISVSGGPDGDAEAAMRRAVELMEASWGPDDPDYREAAAELEALTTNANH